LPANKGGLWNKRSLIVGGILLFTAVAAICALGLTRHDNTAEPVSAELPSVHKATPEEQALSWKTEFGQFPPYTDAERELEKMLHGKDEDIDLALANWLIVADIPEFHGLTREAYLGQLDAMTEQVRQDMVKMQAKGWPNADSDNPETRCRRFCSAVIGLHFDYAEEFREENLKPKQMFALYANPDNIFFAGLMRTKQGSCVSMPMIYLVIGERLGMPVHLVCIGKHFLIRWDEPLFRVDIETTIVAKIAWTTDESVYLDSEGMTRDQLRGVELRNLTNREVLGEMFHARSSYWHTKMGKNETQSCLDIARASYLAPDDPNIKGAHEAVFNHYGIKPEYKSIEIDVKPTAEAGIVNSQ
jgi:hypothetical protein